MVVEIHKWMGVAPLSAALEALRPAQRQEVDALFEQNPQGSAVATRFRKTDLAKQAAASASGQAGSTSSSAVSAGSRPAGETSAPGSSAPPNIEIDPLEFVDPVDVLSKIPKDFFEKLVSFLCVLLITNHHCTSRSVFCCSMVPSGQIRRKPLSSSSKSARSLRSSTETFMKS